MPPAEQATERAAQLKRLAALPEHLRLGVTLAGMRELLKQMPLGAVVQVNAKSPREIKRLGCFTWKGKPKFPKNDTFNGYTNQPHPTTRSLTAQPHLTCPAAGHTQIDPSRPSLSPQPPPLSPSPERH